MKLAVVVLLLSFIFQAFGVTNAENDILLSRIDRSETSSRILQAQTDDNNTTAAPIPITTVNETDIPSISPMIPDTTSSTPPTGAPSFALTVTLAPTLTGDETRAPEESSAGLKATDIALIVVGLLGVGFLGFGVVGSFLSGSKNAVNESLGADFPAPSTPTPEGIEIAEA